MITILYHSKDVVVVFLSSVYLGSYCCLNMGNLNMLKGRPPPQACLIKGCYAWCHTRWRGLEFHLMGLILYDSSMQAHWKTVYLCLFVPQEAIGLLGSYWEKELWHSFLQVGIECTFTNVQ